MGCGRSKPAETRAPASAPASAPAVATPTPTITSGSGTNQKILNLGNGQVFDIYEDDFKIDFTKRNTTINGNIVENHIINFDTHIGSSTPIGSADPHPRITIFKNNVKIYDHDFPLEYGLYTNEFPLDKSTFNNDGDIFKVEFNFSIYKKTIEKTLDLSQVTEGFISFKKGFNIDGYSDENPLLGKVYSPFTS